MDPHKLRSLVFEKTGARIDVDDPVFALVAMNEAILEEALARLAAASGQPVARPQARAAAAIDWRTIGVAAVAALLGGLLVAVLARPAPAPAAAPATLTPEQTAALERAAKLDKAIQKLDAKTRSALQAELQK
ncbi:hypothetical protein [Massilia sp. TS11]|uniref:hypothetical protein n=1 Tax=Massilia sp. TS11 TaxID=2908003 RepID=UPI001EDA30DA|nr:hypothetical protein [Massilia sp. TS11]MCG2586405.1 hypothetical protein [Massilia sp. TS11]